MVDQNFKTEGFLYSLTAFTQQTNTGFWRDYNGGLEFQNGKFSLFSGRLYPTNKTRVFD